MLIDFDRQNEAFQLALETNAEYCADKKGSDNCEPCGEIQLQLVSFMRTMQEYRQALRYLKTQCGAALNSSSAFMEAALYCDLDLPDSALLITANYIQVTQQGENSIILVHAFNNHGLIAKRLNRLDEAVPAFSTAILLLDSLDEYRDFYHIIAGNLGSIYFLKGDDERAYEYLSFDSEWSLKEGNIRSFTYVERDLTTIDIRRKDYQKAIARLNILLEKNEHAEISARLAVLELFMIVYKATGNVTEYDYYAQQWMSLKKVEIEENRLRHKEVVGAYAANSLRQVTKQLEVERKLFEEEQASEKIKLENERLNKSLWIGALVTAILFILFFFWRYRSNQRKRTLIRETQLQLSKTEQEFLELKVKEETRNVKALSLELLVKQDFSMNLIEQLDQVEGISRADKTNIQLYIQNELDVKSARAQFEDQMGELSGAFYNKIKTEHPNLTKIDLKLAAMVVMKMTNKEIAVSKNITVESVSIAKNRLKKKLNLGADDDLSAQLSNLL